MAQASFGYFGVGIETVPGTAVPPTKFLPVKDVNFPISTDFIETREIRGSRMAYNTYPGPVRPDVNFTTSFYPGGGMGVLLKSLFGSIASSTLVPTSTTAYKHIFADAATLPSLSFERSDARGAGSGIIVQRVNGCKIESMGFTANYGEDVEVSVAAQGLGFPTTPGSKPGAFVYPAYEPFIFSGAAISIDGTANNLFKSINFEFTNTLERQESLRGTREAYKIYEGGMACTLSGTMIFDDLTIYTKLQSGVTFAVVITFTGALIDAAPTPDAFYTAQFTFPKVRVSNFDIPMTAGEVMEADAEFNVSFDQTAGYLVDVQLTNLEAGTVYNT